MTYKIAFRLDGGHKIGMGHVVRCLALAHELEERERPHILFVIKDTPEVVSQIKKEGYDVKTLLQDEPNQTYSLLEKFKPDLILNDIPHSLEEYMRKLQNLCPTINYDDMGNGRVYADILIDVTIKPYTLRLGQSMYLHGPEYLILRKQFQQLRDNGYKRKISKIVKKVLVLMGGSDPDNLINKVLDDLELIDETLDIVVIAGPGYRSVSWLQRKSSESKHQISLQFDVNGDKLIQLLLDADIGIGHYGISAYEMASVGLPFAAIAHNEEELLNNRINEFGFCLDIGLGESLRKGDISSTLDQLLVDMNLRQKLCDNGMKTIDAKGLDRVTGLILNILKG